MPFDETPTESLELTRLRKTRALLSDPHRWTKHALHRSVPSTNGEVITQYCLVGAYNVAHHGHCNWTGREPDIWNGFVCALDFSSISEVVLFNNDANTRHDDLLQRLDDAIERLEQDQLVLN